MTGKPIGQRDATVRFEDFEAMPPASPLSSAFKALSDEDIERRAADDPDAGVLPAGFWDGAEIVDPGNGETVTLRLDPEVLVWFRSLGTDYRLRMNAVLKSYMQDRKKAG